MNRDERTYDTVSEDQLTLLKTKTIAVVGSGGLGGYVIEMLARFGIGRLIIIDGDVFDETNLNRQLYANEDNLGCVKVDEAKKRVKKVHSGVQVMPFHRILTKDNAHELLKGADLVMDCVDNVQARFIMADACSTLGIPMVHGAVGAWNGQVMTLMPGEQYMSMLYGEASNDQPVVGAASFIPAMVASYQVAEAVKYLSRIGELLVGKMMVFDLRNNENFVVTLKVDETDEEI